MDSPVLNVADDGVCMASYRQLYSLYGLHNFSNIYTSSSSSLIFYVSRNDSYKHFIFNFLLKSIVFMPKNVYRPFQISLLFATILSLLSNYMLHRFKILFFLFCYQTRLIQVLPNLLHLDPMLCSAHSWG